ncbi:MAG: DUF3421 domain-containing protein [Alphaproteobacteria bacterium]
MRFTGIFRGLGLRAVTLAGLGLAAGLSLAAPDARAQNFQTEVGNRSSLRLGEIPSLGSFLNSIGAGDFANTEIASVTVTPNTIAGTVGMMGLDWNFLLFKAGTAGTDSFIAMEPRRTFKFSDMFANVPGMSLVDVMTFDRQVLVFAAKESDLKADGLPAEARAFFQPYFGNATLDVKFSQGMTMYAALDLGKVAPLRDAIQFIGGQSSVVRLRAAMAFNILGSISKKEKPVPSLQMAAALPTIRPTIGGRVTLPVDFTFGLQSELSPTSVKMGYVAETDFPFAYPNVATKRIDTARTKMGLEVSFEQGLDSPIPTFAVNATMFKDAPFNQAFGIPFISMENYVVNFEQSADAIAIGVGASGKFYDKKIETFGSAQVRASTAGVPIPQKIKFMVTPDNPNSIAALSLSDLGRAFVDLTSTIAGQRLNMPALPDDFVRISGMRAGEGPFIDATLDLGLDFGLEAAGNLVVFGKTMAEVEKAVIKPTHGIEIKAKSADQSLGPIVMPNAEVDVNLTAANISDPRVRIRGSTQEILGSVGVMEIDINKDRQIGIMEGATPFKMFQATLILENNTRNITAPNFTATGIIEGDWFNKLADGLTNATADLVKGTESVVAAMNGEIHTFSQKLSQAKIDKSKAVTDLEAARRSANAAFDKAKRDVDSLQGTYNSQNGKCNGYPWNWHHCVAAGATWVALQSARGVLDLAQRAVNGFLQGTGAALSAIIDGLNATINGLGQAIDVASQALGRAAVTFTKTLDMAAKLAGKALEAVASVFDIDKVWMQGQLAILQGQQKGELGIQYTLLSKEYLKSVGWNFRVPVEDIIKVFQPGSSGSPAPVVIEAKYSYAPSTTATARDISNQLVNEGTLKAVTVPFDPNVCVKEPYAIDRHIAEIKAEQAKISNFKLNAQAYAYTLAAEASPGYIAMQANPAGGGALNWANPGAQPMVIGGQEPGRQLPICRANFNNGTHPGKVVDGRCNISYGGREHQITSFQVLVGSGARWVGASGGQVPQGAFIGGQEPGRQLPICRAAYNNGIHPGKLVAQNCNIGYGGREIEIRNYEVLMAGSALLPQQAAAYGALVANYRSMKTLTAEREFTAQRVNGLRDAVTAFGNTLNTLAANDNIRVQINNYVAQPSKQQANLNPNFLQTQENDLTATLAQLERLKANPASPCGKAAQQAGVQPPAAPAPVTQARAVQNAQDALQKVQAAIQAQQNAVLQALKLPGARGVTPPTDQQAQQTAAAAGGTAFSTEAAVAALALATQQQAQGQKVADEAKRQAALAFVQKLQQHKAAADKAAAANAAVEKSVAQIKSTIEAANAQQKQQLAANAQTGAQKAAAAAKVPAVAPPVAPRAFVAPGTVPTAAAVAAPGSPASRAAPAPAVAPVATAQGLQGGARPPVVVFQPKPLMNLSPAVRAAFARELAQDEAKAKAPTPAPAAAGGPAARGVVAVAGNTAQQIEQRVVAARAASVQSLQTTPAAKGLPATAAPQAIVNAEAQSGAFEKAALLKSTNRLPGRQSQIPGAPDSVATQPGQTDAEIQPVAHVTNDYLNNLQILRQIPR